MANSTDEDALTQLVQAHPSLFRGAAPLYSDLPPGWFELVDRLCTQIESELGPEMTSRVAVQQIKEKFGTLRFYANLGAQGRLHVDVVGNQGVEKLVFETVAASDGQNVQSGDGERLYALIDARAMPLHQSAKYAARPAHCAHLVGFARCAMNTFGLRSANECVHGDATVSHGGSLFENTRLDLGFVVSVRKASVSFTRIISIDFDGVCHPSPRCVPQREDVAPMQWLDFLSTLLVGHPDVGLLVHSSWRGTYTDDELQGMLHPMEIRFVGSTPPGSRAQAILQWIAAHSNVHLLVIDDEPHQFDGLEAIELVACDPRDGLSSATVQAAVQEWLKRTVPPEWRHPIRRRNRAERP